MLQIHRLELFEGVQRAVDPDDALGEALALLVGDRSVLDPLAALQPLPAEVLLRPLDPVALSRWDRIAALDLEDERLEFDLLALHLDHVGDGRADGRGLAVDAFQ